MNDRINNLICIIYMLYQFTDIPCVNDGTFGYFEKCKCKDEACHDCSICKKIWNTIHNWENECKIE